MSVIENINPPNQSVGSGPDSETLSLEGLTEKFKPGLPAAEEENMEQHIDNSTAFNTIFNDFLESQPSLIQNYLKSYWGQGCSVDGALRMALANEVISHNQEAAEYDKALNDTALKTIQENISSSDLSSNNTPQKSK
ncbi:MAG: hypothetical protein PHV30_11015 [Candidatus Margulisbacteria bacterium]|nr:hypothetical protein [Candidatus Margulisiibacteriota bacterium]